MKSKITKIQNLLMKGIAIIISAMMSITPMAYATTNLNDNGDFDLSIIDQILYGKVGATAKEIEKYFAEGHTTLYISSEIQLRALAEYVNSAHPNQNKDLGNGITCNVDHSCEGKEIILTKNIVLSDEEWDPIGKVITSTATQTSESNTGTSSTVTEFTSDHENPMEEGNYETEPTIYIEQDEGEEQGTDIQPYESIGGIPDINPHTADDEAIAEALFSASEETVVTSTAFKGFFNGNGFTISNLKYSKGSKEYKKLQNIGLFGVTGKNAIIKNLIVDSFNINLPHNNVDLYLENGEYLAKYANAGNIVGYNQGKIENCINNSNICGLENVGGIAGYSIGEIKNCSNKGTVTGYKKTGGIVGHIYKANLSDCINLNDINGELYTGGIAGYINESETINNCGNSAKIVGKHETAGIVGKVNKSKLESLNNYGEISGKDCTGGIIGYAENSTITKVLNNAENTKTIFGTGNSTGGIAGRIDSCVMNRAVNKMPVRGYEKIGGIAGFVKRSDVYYVYNMDSMTTENTSAYDVIGVENVGGLIGELHSSSLRRSGTTAEVLGVKSCIGGVVGLVKYGTNYTDTIWGINKIASLGATRLDVDHWTFSSETKGTYENSENPVVQKLTITEPCFGVASIVGFLVPTKDTTTAISNNYIFGNVVGMKGTGSTVGWLTSAEGTASVRGTIRDGAYTYIESRVKTSSGNKYKKISLKGEDKNGTVVTSSSIKQSSNLGYGLKYTNLICGVNNKTNSASNVDTSFYTKDNLGNQYADKFYKDADGKYVDGTTTEKYEDNTVKYGIYGVEYKKGPDNNKYYDFKVQPSATATSITLPIVKHDDTLEDAVIGTTVDESTVGKASQKSVEGTVGSYKVNYKLYKNNTEITGETYLKSGDKLKVEATVNAPLVNMIDISNNITNLSTQTAPTLSLKNGDTVVGTVTPKSISGVTTSSTETKFTYEYDVTEETTTNEKINKVILNKVGTLYVVGTTSQITNSTFGEAETMDILFDDVAPEIITNMYVEQPLETNRYTAGKEVLFRVTTNERIYGNYVLPELRVRFSKSGIGKYMYSNDANPGFAKVKSSEIKLDGTTEWIYSYIIQEGDEGEVIAEFTKGTIIDRAGNETYLQDKYATPKTKEESALVKEFGESFKINSIKFYKKVDNKYVEIDPKKYQNQDIYVEVEFDDALYVKSENNSTLAEKIKKETAPKLFFNDDIATTAISVSEKIDSEGIARSNALNNTVIYKFDKTTLSVLTMVDYITLKNENEKLYYGNSTIALQNGIDANKKYQMDIDNIFIDPTNQHGENAPNRIYADTTLPTVEITPYKVDHLPTDNHVVVGEKIENNATNANIIRYRFRFSENIVGFTEDDITVNFGTKKGLYELNNKLFDLYVETNTKNNAVRDLELILEQDAVQDLVYQGNVRRENTITVDKKAPVLENYTVQYDEENGKIIVEATFDEAISSVGTSKINVLTGGIEGKGTYEAEVIPQENGTPSKVVRYTYTKSGEDGGKVVITLNGKVKDLSGNSSDELNENIENDIAFKRSVIKIGNAEYSFKKNDEPAIVNYAIPTYFKIGDRIKVSKKEGDNDSVDYEGIINNTDLAQMKGMILVNDKYQFNTNASGIDITSANIFFDTKAPTVTTEVTAVNSKDGLYKAGDELTIVATSSEEVKAFTYFNSKEIDIEPKIKVKFNTNKGKFNNGNAEFVNTITNENGTTSWVYRYVISDGDEGNIGLSYGDGFVRDFAGNETILSSLNSNNNYFKTNGIVADTTLPTVKIVAIDSKYDFNEDGVVNNTDVSKMQEVIGERITSGKIFENVNLNGDINNNGTIDIQDVTLLQEILAGHKDGIKITNSDIVQYLFVWSEEVVGFTPEDITVNSGTKGELSKIENTNTYVMNVTTSVENGNTGDIQVIVEKDSVQDRAGYGNVRTENVIRVDKQSPILISLEAYGDSEIKVNDVDTVKQYYKAGDTIRIVATFNENIENSTAPTLNLQFSESGNAKNAVSVESIVGNKITYKYVIKNEDNGTLSVKAFTGKVKDTVGNETVVTKRALDGDTIIADTKAPTLVSLTAIAPTFEYSEFTEGNDLVLDVGVGMRADIDDVRYGVESKTRDNNTITIIAEYSESIYQLVNDMDNNTTSIENITNEDLAPVLRIKFENNEENSDVRIAKFLKAEGNKIYYTYKIADGDNGNLTIESYIGAISDIAGNQCGTRTNEPLPELTKYEAEIKDENKVNEIVADTKKPSYTISATAVDKDDKLNDITGNGSYYRKGSIITITATTNELIYKNDNKVLTWFTKETAPTLTVKFGNTAGVGQVECTDVQYSGNNTIFTYEYVIADGDNGTLTAAIAANTGYDIALNGNNEKVQQISNIIADTVNPVTNWQSWVDSEEYGIEDELNGTWVVTFSETMYVYDDNAHKVGSVLSNSNKSSAPILLISNDNETPIETTISSIATVNGKTVITYTYSPYTRNLGAYGMKFASVSDKAGNLFNFKDQTPPVLSSIEVTDPEAGTYKAGTEVTIVATFSEKVTGTAPTLKLKFGDEEAKGTVSSGVIEDNTITYKYTITDVTDGDNGKLEVLSYTGTELKDLYDNKWVAPETISISGNRIIADTKAPTAIITVYDKTLDLNGDGKVNNEDVHALQEYFNGDNTHKAIIEEYGDLNNDGKINSSDVLILMRVLTNGLKYDIRKNTNTVIYTITWSEPVYGFKADDIEVVNGLKGTFTGKDGDTVYTLQVDTVGEGRQIVRIPAYVCKDIAGNDNTERAIYSNVVMDNTKPEVRAKVNGGKYVIDIDKEKSTLKEIIVVNEELSEFKYAWSNNRTTPTSGWVTLNTDNIGINSDIPINVEVDNAGPYYLHIEVTDLAGNKYTGVTNEFTVSNDRITITPSTSTVTNNDVIATISYGTGTTGLTQNRKAGVQGKTQSADPTKVILTENGTVYAEATDINGNKVYATLKVTNIDKTAPVINATLDDKTITITSKDTDIEKYIVTTTSEIPETDVEGWQEENTKTLTEDGTYYVWAIDKAGNISEAKIVVIDTTAPTANITYVTNEDGTVTATITLSDGRVTNNNGQTTYVFTKNGEFTFEFVDEAGNRGTAVAKVTTITEKEEPQPQPEPTPTPEDKTAPELTFNYTTTSATVGTRIGAVITTNEDAKISYKWNDGSWKTSNDFIRNYNITYTPASTGTYTLYAKAVDKAGNESTIKTLVFTIVNTQEEVKDPEIEFEGLTVLQKNGVKYVKVSPTFTVSQLTAKMNKEKLLGKTPTYSKLTTDNKLRTGSEIALDGSTKYVVIVNGDVNCDGKVDFINDIIMLNNYRIGKINNLSEIQILAGDINNSGTIDFIPDIISINNYRLGKINTL